MLNTDQPIDVTGILAQPREFLRRYESVLAKLLQAQAELDEWRSGRRTYVSPAELQAMIERRDPALSDEGDAR